MHRKHVVSIGTPGAADCFPRGYSVAPMPEYQPPPLPDAGPPGSPPLPEPLPEPSRRFGPMVPAIAAILIGAAVATTIVLVRSGDNSESLAPGWKRTAVAAEGFSVALPPGWKPVSTTSADRAFETLKAANPGLANLVKDQLQGLNLSTLIKLLAFDTQSPTLAQQFATNMNVVVAPAAGVDIGTFLSQNLSQLTKTTGLTNVSSSRLELPAGPAGLVKSQLTVNAPGGAQQVAITQYLVVNGEKGYIMSFSTLPGSVASYADQFLAIAKTFRFEN